MALSSECNQRFNIAGTQTPIKDLIGLSSQSGLNKNVCHFSAGSICCWNLHNVFCVGFSFQAFSLISHSGISSSSTVYCKAPVTLSAVCVCVCGGGGGLQHPPGCVVCISVCVSAFLSLWDCQLELVYCIRVCLLCMYVVHLFVSVLTFLSIAVRTLLPVLITPMCCLTVKDVYKDGQHVSTSSHYTEMKTKYPGYEPIQGIWARPIRIQSQLSALKFHLVFEYTLVRYELPKMTEKLPLTKMYLVIGLALDPSANMEEAGFMSYTPANHQVAIETLWLLLGSRHVVHLTVCCQDLVLGPQLELRLSIMGSARNALCH